MIKIIDKTPRYSILYKRRNLKLKFQKGYEIIGIDRRGERDQLSLYLDSYPFVSWICILPHQDAFYAGDISIGSFHDEGNKESVLKKRIPHSTENQMPSALKSSAFEKFIQEEYDNFRVEREIYDPLEKFYNSGRYINMGFSEWGARITAFCNQFIHESNNRLAMIQEKTLLRLDHKDTIESTTHGHAFQFRI